MIISIVSFDFCMTFHTESPKQRFSCNFYTIIRTESSERRVSRGKASGGTTLSDEHSDEHSDVPSDEPHTFAQYVTTTHIAFDRANVTFSEAMLRPI